jgi:hypothetical protein
MEYTGRAWILTENPHNLPTPPAYFLNMLAAYDHDLVVHFSTIEPLYRLCRRSDQSHPIFHTLVKKHPDFAICIAHRLVPLTSILPAAMCFGDPWPDVFAWLNRLDYRKFEDTAHKSAADRFSEYQDKLDEDDRARRRQQNEDKLHVLTGDFHRALKKGFGELVYENEPAEIRTRGQQQPFNFRPGGSSVTLPGVNQSQPRASVTGKELIATPGIVIVER